ncbi:hypothetical protein [Lactococcus cremoris]|jgi:hypothetical protein|uniref:hypothetical protein n=1 Tax=Lactococcus lactis subsp. cremoris TaxID=1359 RepID=UPI0021AA0F03
MGWKDRPTAINNLEIDGGYIFAIDENGTSILPESNPFMDESEKDPNKQWLTLTGIMVNLEEYNLIQKNIIDLKNKYWKDGLFGQGTIKALQKHLGTTQDGTISPVSDSVKELQRRLNANKL